MFIDIYEIVFCGFTLVCVSLVAIAAASKLETGYWIRPTKNNKQGRFELILKDYNTLCKIDKKTGIGGLIQCGIVNLLSENEASDFIKLVTKFQHVNPLGDREKIIKEIGILNFFRNISYEDWRIGDTDEIINKLNLIKK